MLILFINIFLYQISQLRGTSLIWGLHTSQYLVIFKAKICILNFLL